MSEEKEQPTLSRLDLPFKNLALTGYLGVGKSTVGRAISHKMEVELLDLDEEIELGEMMSISKIRELYGDSRLKKIEHDLCRRAALMRRSVIVLPGAALFDERNFKLISDTSMIVVLNCEIGEALRRLHISSYLHYRDAELRGRMIGRIRREYPIVMNSELLQLDTTHLSVEEEADLLIQFWMTGEPSSKLFRVGPRAPIKPPEKNPVGLSSWDVKQVGGES